MKLLQAEGVNLSGPAPGPASSHVGQGAVHLDHGVAVARRDLGGRKRLLGGGSGWQGVRCCLPRGHGVGGLLLLLVLLVMVVLVVMVLKVRNTSCVHAQVTLRCRKRKRGNQNIIVDGSSY